MVPGKEQGFVEKVEGCALPSGIERYARLVEERPGLFTQSPVVPLVLDAAELAQFERETGRKMGVAYESPWHLLVVDLAVDPSTGRRFPYERVLPASEGVPVVAIPKIACGYVLLRQYRHPIRRDQFAFPRGFGENGLSGEENAAKELEEELHAKATGIELVGRVCPDSGFLGTEAAVYLCEIGGFETVESEGILNAVEFTAEEIHHLILAGAINDGFTLAAWALLSARETNGGWRSAIDIHNLCGDYSNVNRHALQ